MNAAPTPSQPMTDADIETSAPPMTDAELRAEYQRQHHARSAARPAPTMRTKSVPEVLEQLEALDDVRLASDHAPLTTCSELTTSALDDFFANRTCAIRVPEFATTRTCREMTRWLSRRELKKWGGTDTSYGAGIPVNALSWSLGSTLSYFREALASIRAVRNACSDRLSPVDKLRLELDELWPMGANVSRENPYRRKMLVGLARVMRPDGLLDGITRVEGLVHTDSALFIDPARGSFSANVYLNVPSSGGEVNIFTLAMKQPEHLQNLVRVVAYLLQHSFDAEHRERVQRQLHALLPAPVTIKPKVGDLVILNTGRPHAVRGFVRGSRVTMQVFVRHRSGRPLQIFS